MAKSDNAEAFSIHRNMLRISGNWPEKHPTKFYNLRAAITWTLGTTLNVTMIMEAMNDITDFTKLSEILYIVVTITIYLIKLITFTYHRKDVMDLINYLKDPIFMSYPADLDHYMVNSIKWAKRITNFYRFLCLCCMIMYTVYPIVDNKPLPFPFPYDLGSLTMVMYVFQIAAVCSCAWTNSCLDTLTPSLMGIATAQFDILTEKITHIANENTEAGENSDKEEKKIIKRLKQCIEHHLAIIRYIESIDSIFAIGFLGQFVASVLVICNTVFHFLLISRTSSQFLLLMNYFIIMVCELYLNCWYGNEIMLKSVLIGEACYKSKWYNYSKEVRQYLFIIMERSKRPLHVTAFKISKLTVSAFVSIIQWSYSYLALLLKLYSQQRSAKPNL